MNVLDDHDATDDALTRLGTRLRSDADRRPADLDRLGTRIHAERQRARLALVAGCAAVVLVLGVAIGVRAGGDDRSLQVGDGDTASIEAPTTEVVPMWTVNPSIPSDPANGEIWGIDVVYDPAVWDFKRFTQESWLVRMDLPGAVPVGMAGFHQDPRIQMYWQGSEARAFAEGARDRLGGQPGIVSVEVGRAEPTSRPPGTSGVVPSLPSTTPTTLGPAVRRDLPDPRPTQDEILADGVVTDVEYDQAFWTWVECAEVAGAVIQVRGADEDGRYQYSISTGIQAADDCYQALFVQVDQTWQVALDQPAPPPPGS